MKNKSTRHKDDNTFKFQPFSERVANIDINIFHKVGHEYETQTEEGESYFYQAIQKWNVLNLTEGYEKFKKEIKADNYITLPQVLLGKEHIIHVLLNYLNERNPLYLQPILEIVIAVAQDLQKEFYPFYQQFLETIIGLLNTKNTEQLEWTFTCLAYLLKILWRPIIKNINEVFNSLLPLLSDSKPEYINSFAAESFAFIARKVKDKQAFLGLLLKAVNKHKDGISGCGKLLFEVINGVNNQFHSCAEQFLPFYFESLWNSQYPQDTLFEILECIVANIAADIHPQKNKLVWDVLFKNVSHLEEQPKEKDFELILRLVGQMVEYKSGKLVQEPSALIQLLIKLFAREMCSEEILIILVQISISVLLSRNIRLPQEQASQLIRKILSLDQKNVLLYFVNNVSSSSSFETLILPAFLRKCGLYEFDKECLYTLTKLVLKKTPLCGSGISLLQWAKYSLDFKDFSTMIFNKLAAALDLHSYEDIEANKESYFCSLICLPHMELRGNDKNVLTKKLIGNLDFLLNRAKEVLEPILVKTVLFWINLVLESLIHLEGSTAIEGSFQEILSVLLKFASSFSYLAALKSLSLLFTVLKEPKAINTDILMELHKVCENNFSSPYHEVRLLTAHIYTNFESLPQFNLKHSNDPEVRSEPFKVFSLIYEVESIEPLVETYRDQLQRLEKLTFDKPQMIMCNKTEFKLIPLRYLCGVLYMNFKLLWNPVSKIIESHAHGLDSNDFWKVFGPQLKGVVENIMTEPVISVDTFETDLEALGDTFQEGQRSAYKVDFINYRVLLWRALAMFPNVAEAKTRDTSQLLLSFIENEYTNTNSEMATLCNVKIFADSAAEDKENCPEEEEDDEEVSSLEVRKLGRKILTKTLLEKLSAFSHFKSPKSMYREQEIYRLYFDLLKHKNAEVQKAALDCLMTYKFKYIIPYKDHLYNLIDEKNFKNAIINFRVDKESTEVQQEHRENLIPVVLQIVFSKMSGKTGLRTGGKASGQNRRNLVLRFLAGCEEDEMLRFVEKAFAIYEKYLQNNEVKQVESIVASIDLEKCLAPKKLLSTVNLLNVILDQFGGLMGDKLLTYLLKIVFVVGATVKGIFDRVDKVHTGYLAILKNVRSATIKILERFFEHFPHYPWNSIQINAIFDTFVWPHLNKLTVEGIHSPTALLRLIKQWGTHATYFKLLVKHHRDDKNLYILPHVFKLLLNEKSNIQVVNVIYEIIESLLKYELGDEEVALEIQPDDLLPVDDRILERCKVNEKLNYGSCILLPHVPSVLEKIKRKLEGKHKSLSRTELFILCRISELVWESEVSASILHLLMPIVLKKATAEEEVVLQLLTTVHNLLRNVEDSTKHLRNLTPLFAEVSCVPGRKILVKTLEYMAENNDWLKQASSLISDLNAFDSKWLDQPDFERRHGAFKKIQLIIQEGTIELSYGILLVYNLFFIMKSEKDLALKDNASHALRSLCPALIKQCQNNHKDLEYVLNDSIFALIKAGMRNNQNNDLRNECISLLGCLARECPDSHFTLRDLNKFTNKTDLEVDIFENLTHLQIHRHARAMLKFCQLIKEETVSINPKTVSQFLLPLATHYLCTDKFAGKNAVIDAAIEMVGMICRITPWHQYESVLKFALSKLRFKLEFQKQLVRLVVAILDAFHYDLSKGHVENVPEAEVPVELEVIENIPDEVGENGDDDEKEEEEVVEDEAVKIVEKTTVLCKSTATRVIKTIQGVLLPQLHKSLAELTHYDSSHKVNRKRTGFEREEEDLAKVPISLAVVKLLQRLPKAILDANLPRIFLKLCTFLKSHLESVRRVARETLQKIMLTLGPKYLGMLLGEINPLMNRGFQVHVLVFTVHGVLNCLKGLYQPGDIDAVLLTVLKLCSADLFGILSEEKEIVKITAKVSEAKSTKSNDTLEILAQHITEKCLMDIILPIKQLLESNHSFKTVQKAQEALRHIALGLVDNLFINEESLLKFAYGTSAQKIPELMPKKKKQKQQNEKEQAREKRDCFIIQKVPGNRTAYRELNVKTSSDTNAHLLVEFGLRLCFVMLKREKIKDQEYRKYLDPFVKIFRDCLGSKHVKLCALTLQCLQWILKYDLPSLKASIKSIVKDMFGILHKYAAAGLSKGDNFDLVVAAFKAMAVLVRDVQYYTVNTNQLKVLLMYVEQDMHDHDRQATAFNLLKAIISRKLIVPEIHDVMGKVAELSITSELNHVRTQARSVFHQFIMEYPLGNSLDKHLSFYISQMSFDMQYGRESAIEMIQALINSFPLHVLKNHSGTLLITLGARLVNDEVPECRKMVAECLHSMLKRLNKLERDSLFDILTLWLKDKEISHRRLAAQLCGIFVTVEQQEFESRLPILTPLLLKQFGLTNENPGKFVKVNKEKNVPEEVQRLKDHHYYQVLQLILKICAYCPVFLKNQSEAIENLGYYTQTLLGYPHEWVRLAAAQFLGFVLSAMDVDNLANLLINNETEPGYLSLDPENSLKSLTLDLCDQLQPGDIKSGIAEQVIKNLVFIAKVLQKIPNNPKRINLLWLSKRMRKIINSEVIDNNNSTTLRTEVFKWIAGVITAIDLNNLKPVMNHLLAPLVREMITTEEKNAPLRQMAKEVANILKKKLGMEEYTRILQSLQQSLTVKRAERKRGRSQLAVTNPEVYAQKKIKMHERKKLAKKRKLEEIRGKKGYKRKKVVDLEDNSEVM
ncbi:small subunit processome component 20 homolog [Anthonomus grandis grandis]|uniref:small subunit processome component 20 homolog n=1 Tax=Anthonomus grandis grandis TaxID=2921223 RepID=UPI002165480A|nr:small subunit processome component 20 homolog [Anthonomus grandis grandis]